MPVFDKDPNGLTRLAVSAAASRRPARVRRRPPDQPDGHPAAQRLRHVHRLRVPDRGRASRPASRSTRSVCRATCTRATGARRRRSRILDRFARFGLPLHLTETTLLSGDLMPAHIEDLNDHQVASWPSTPEGEARQADEIERHYRTLVGHPAVQAATYWGIPTRAPGSAHPPGSSAPTAPPSPRTTRCAGWSRTSGGWRRRRCGPSTPAACPSAGSAGRTRWTRPGGGPPSSSTSRARWRSR